MPASARPRSTTDKLVENIRAFADAVAKAKPAGAKGTYIQRVAISSTMGPGVKVDPASVLGGVRLTPDLSVRGRRHAAVPRTHDRLRQLAKRGPCVHTA